MSTTQQEQTRAAAPQEYLLEMRGITKAFAGVQALKGDLGAKTGKGFYDWSTRSIEDDMKKRDAFIIEAVKAVERVEKK